jgi:catechol 2,3-dioxygenase-like lactoylglutathione lyase family enzyme
LTHVELVPSGVKKTIDFYTEILGFKLGERLKLENNSQEVSGG